MCGFEVVRESGIEHETGHMEEIVFCGKKKLADTHADLYAQLATMCRSGGKKPGWVAYKFRELTGDWPPRGWSVETAPEIEPTRNTLNKIRSMQIAWARGRRSA